MIRLFLKVFILNVFVVLSIKWTAEAILFSEVYSDRKRVIAGLSEVHQDQLQFFAEQLVALPPHKQVNKVADFRETSVAPLVIRPTAELSKSERLSLRKSKKFIVRYEDGMIDYLGVPLSDDFYLLYGPLGHLSNRFIELQVDGWLKELRKALESSRDVQSTITKFSSRFRIPIRLEQRDRLPDRVSEKMIDSRESIFYQTDAGSFVALELRGSPQVLCLGPMLEVTNYAQVAVRTGIFLWLTGGVCCPCLVDHESIFEVSENRECCGEDCRWELQHPSRYDPSWRS